MGLFKKMMSFGEANQDLVRHGLLGRGIVLQVKTSGSSLQVAGRPPEYVCQFQLQVFLDNTPPFMADTKERVPEYQLGQFQPNATAVAVWVDPDNHSRVAIDFNTPPPDVQLAQGGGSGTRSAADVIATGTPCQAVIIKFDQFGMRNAAGDEIYDIALTAIPDGATPYQTSQAMPVPAKAMALLYPGSKVPAKIATDDRTCVVIDWEQASSGQPAVGATTARPVHCTNCGALIDPGSGGKCSYCGTAV